MSAVILDMRQPVFLPSKSTITPKSLKRKMRFPATEHNRRNKTLSLCFLCLLFLQSLLLVWVDRADAVKFVECAGCGKFCRQESFLRRPVDHPDSTNFSRQKSIPTCFRVVSCCSADFLRVKLGIPNKRACLLYVVNLVSGHL